jgi:hypothetical protein
LFIVVCNFEKVVDTVGKPISLQVSKAVKGMGFAFLVEIIISFPFLHLASENTKGI